MFCAIFSASEVLYLYFITCYINFYERYGDNDRGGGPRTQWRGWQKYAKKDERKCQLPSSYDAPSVFDTPDFLNKINNFPEILSTRGTFCGNDSFYDESVYKTFVHPVRNFRNTKQISHACLCKGNVYCVWRGRQTSPVWHHEGP